MDQIQKHVHKTFGTHKRYLLSIIILNTCSQRRFLIPMLVLSIVITVYTIKGLPVLSSSLAGDIHFPFEVFSFFPVDLDDLDTDLDLQRTTSWFHGVFATGVACKHGVLTFPDTWLRLPLWGGGGLLMLQLLKQVFSNLRCLFSTFYLEYPLVLSLFYFITAPQM